MQGQPSTSTPPTSWSMVRLYDDGMESHWGTQTFNFTSDGGIGRMTDRLPCEGVWLRWTAGSYDYKWHATTESSAGRSASARAARRMICHARMACDASMVTGHVRAARVFTVVPCCQHFYKVFI